MIDIDKFKEYCKAKFTKENDRILAAYEQHPQYHGRTDIFERLRDVNRKPTFLDLAEYIAENGKPNTGRYLIFNYENYYPCGGMEDLLIRTDDIDNFKEAIKCLEDFDNLPGYLNYFDIDTNETIDLEKEMKNDRTS